MNDTQTPFYKLNAVLLILTFWCIPWYVYNCYIRTKEFHPMGHLKFPTPRWMSCAIPYVSTNPKKNNCENVKFDGWSIGHVAIYFTLGLVLPGHWLSVLALSIGCELFEYMVGWRARWIIDPVANLVGYALGHMYFIVLPWVWMQYGTTTAIIFVLLLFILFMNRPCMIPRSETFY